MGHRSVSGPRPPSAVWAHTRNVFRVVRRLGSGQASAQVLVRFLPQCVAHVHSRAAHWATAGACRSKGSENLQMQFCMAISVDYTVYNFQVRTLAAREHDTTCRELVLTQTSVRCNCVQIAYNERRWFLQKRYSQFDKLDNIVRPLSPHAVCVCARAPLDRHMQSSFTSPCVCVGGGG